MLHCHNITHEDHDMMVQFAVGNPRRQRPHHRRPAGSGHHSGGLLRPGIPARIPVRDLT